MSLKVLRTTLDEKENGGITRGKEGGDSRVGDLKITQIEDERPYVH